MLFKKLIITHAHQTSQVFQHPTFFVSSFTIVVSKVLYLFRNRNKPSKFWQIHILHVISSCNLKLLVLTYGDLHVPLSHIYVRLHITQIHFRGFRLREKRVGYPNIYTCAQYSFRILGQRSSLTRGSEYVAFVPMRNL